MNFNPASRSKLTAHDHGRFTGDALFARIARVVCDAECLPRKELYEAWEVARRARRKFRGGRVLDLACGHALVAHLMLLLDDSSPMALAVDTRLPSSAAKLSQHLVRRWPRLAGRVHLVESSIDAVKGEAGDVIVSCHACGDLTDQVLQTAMQASARVVVLPCCHAKSKAAEGGLGGWLDSALAIDVTRVATLQSRGYLVYTQQIPSAVTPKNRLLLAEPARDEAIAARSATDSA
ncbi:MAG TPA: methyltransferase [Polyangiaceae bacterium]